MKNKTFVVAMTALLMLITASVVTFAASDNSAVGTWKLDVQKSSFGNTPAPKFEELMVTTDSPTAVKWSLKGVAADGKSYLSSYDGPVDSQPHPMMSSEAGSTVAYTRSGATLNWIMRNKDGAVLEMASGQVSPDGKTLTIRGTMQGASGRSGFLVVYERTK